MKEKIKSHWKEILIVIFVCFSLNKCTQSCNRQGVIDKQTTELISKDSTINIQKSRINSLLKDSLTFTQIIQNDRDMAGTFTGFANDELLKKQEEINNLKSIISTKDKKINSLERELNLLKQK